MNSPLGKYAQPVAALVAVVVIVAYLGAAIAGLAAASTLLPLATLAFGAVFGAATTVNGYKPAIEQMQAQFQSHLAAQPDAATTAATAATAAVAAVVAMPANGGSGPVHP